MQDFEPTMEQIDDYNGKESETKKNTIKNVIWITLTIGAVLALAHHLYGVVDDQIPGVPDLVKRF